MITFALTTAVLFVTICVIFALAVSRNEKGYSKEDLKRIGAAK